MLRYAGTSSRALQYISGQTVREQSDLAPEQYLDFIVLLGTDASPRISKVGPVTAYKLIKLYGSIEGILEAEPRIRERIPEGYMDMVKAARKVFTELPEVPADAELKQGVWDEYKVIQWLEAEHGLSLMEMEDDRDGIESPRWSRSFVEERFEALDGSVDGEPDWEELVKSALEELEGMDEQLQDDSVLEDRHSDGVPWAHQINEQDAAFLDEEWHEAMEEDWTAIANEELRKM